MILIIGCLLPPPLHPEATIPLDLLGANPAGAPLCAEVKCRSNFVLQFKELKEQGVGGGIYLTSHGALPPPTALRVLRATLHQLQGARRSLADLGTRTEVLYHHILWLSLWSPPASVF